MFHFFLEDIPKIRGAMSTGFLPWTLKKEVTETALSLAQAVCEYFSLTKTNCAFKVPWL
jgi:hypothetical protein